MIVPVPSGVLEKFNTGPVGRPVQRKGRLQGGSGRQGGEAEEEENQKQEHFPLAQNSDQLCLCHLTPKMTSELPMWV